MSDLPFPCRFCYHRFTSGDGRDVHEALFHDDEIWRIRASEVWRGPLQAYGVTIGRLGEKRG